MKGLLHMYDYYQIRVTRDFLLLYYIETNEYCVKKKKITFRL